MTEALAKSARKMGVIEKTAGHRYLAERLSLSQRRAPLKKPRSAIKAKRIDEMTAGCAALAEELLEIAC